MSKIKLGALTVYGDLTIDDNPVGNLLNDIKTVSGTYVLDYLTSNYHRLIINGDTTLVISNLPIGELMVCYVSSSGSGSVIFGNTELLESSADGKFHILFGNPEGTPCVIGKPSQISF